LAPGGLAHGALQTKSHVPVTPFTLLLSVQVAVDPVGTGHLFVQLPQVRGDVMSHAVSLHVSVVPRRFPALS
jgi:hypothetical protein